MSRVQFGIVWLFLVVKCCCCDEHFENVALAKPCNMSSQWHDYPVGNAVNGNTGGKYDKGNCIHSGPDDYNSFWLVNLCRRYPVYSITIWAREPNSYGIHIQKMAYCKVYVGNKLCYEFPQNTTDLPRRIDLNCTDGVINGRVVKVFKNVTRSTFSGNVYAINFCEVQIWSCSDRYWGSGCDQVCGECRDAAPCDKVTGNCPATCVDGWHGEKCDKLCSVNCTGTCDQNTGNCRSCKYPGVLLPLCREGCPDDTFGQNCSENCSQNCADVCDKISGHCTCQAGWEPPNCTIGCSDGYWESGCDRVCGECRDDAPCDKVTGNCPDRCVDGWHGEKCDKNCSANCTGTCDQNTGNCHGCRHPGVLLPQCREGCPDGKFGQNCSEDCSQNCADVCDKISGHCTCQAGWEPPNCTIECLDGYYGQSCNQTCSVNCQNISCDKVSGYCTCKPGLKPPHCTEETMAANTGDTTPVIAGSAAAGGVVLLLVVILLVFLIRRRRTSREQPDEARVVERSDITSDLTSPVYQNVADMDSEPISAPDTTDTQYTRPVALVMPKLESKPSPAQHGQVYENVAFSRDEHPTLSRQPTVDTETGDDDEASGLADDVRQADDVYYNDDEYMTSQAVTLGLDRVQQYLLEKLRGDILDDEFQNLPTGLQRDSDEGSKGENRPKNRFNNTILPYDATRVILHGNPGPDTHDYINASYIRGYSQDKAYIAAQGPKTNTVCDFWQMVWQEKITHIVMLTKLTEGEKNKCVKYWPRMGKRCRYSSVEVTGLDVDQRADCVIRTFDVKRTGATSSRHVTQYHYVTWPDHSVPTATALVDVWRTVTTSHRNQQSPSPLLVHCSAGVGRTGTFIALDIAMDSAGKQSKIDIFAIVQRMREDRVNMVQAKSQYRFVHEAILEAYTSRHTRLALIAFNSFVPQDIDPTTANDRIDSEYKLLNQMKVLLHKPSHTVAKDEENIGKNRTLDILPDDSHLVYLSSHVRGRNQYINAVFMPTFFSRRGCIVTQLPLYHTMVDIWRLVHGNDVTTIVSLGAEVDGPEAECCYWPRQEGQSMEFGPFTVTLSSMAILGQHLTSYTLSLQSQSSSCDREVNVLQYSGWTHEVPDSTPDILHLVDLINARACRDVDEDDDDRDSKDNKVIVQCFDGARKSGLFRAICDAISRMTYDSDVDVYMAARHVQIVRPESVDSLVQYRYLFHVIQEYQKRNAVYNNA